MNFKKILSLVLSVMMILTSVSVFGTEEITTPDAEVLKTQVITDLDVTAVPVYDLGAEEDLTLDFGMSFEALEDYEDAMEQPYFNYIVDFKLTFDQDVTAVLAGQYGDYPWIAIKAEEYTPDFVGGLAADVDGIKFNANESVFVMGGQDIVNANLTYDEVISGVRKFDCGVKFAYNTLSGTTAKLELVMIPTKVIEHEGTHSNGAENGSCDFYKDGVCYGYDRADAISVDTVEYTYNKNALGINTETTDEKKAAIIEEKLDEITASEEAAMGALDIIATLPQDIKDAIAPETIVAIIEATGADIENVTDATVFETSANGTITVTINEATPEEEFEDYDDVYEVTATCSVDGPVDTTPAPVLVAIPVADASLVYAVKHLHDGVVEDLPFVRGNGVIYVQMSKFSQIAVLSNNALQTGEAEVKLVEKDAPRGQAWFDVVLAGADVDAIKGFTAGSFVVSVDGITDDNFDYEIVNADEDTAKAIAISYNALDAKINGAREYLLDVPAFDKNGGYTVDVNNEVVLAKIIVTDYEDGEISISDVKFRQFDYAQEEENLEKDINVVRETGAAYDIEVPTQKLTIEIDFNHATETNNEAEYQDMWVEIIDANGVETIKLGNDNGDVEYTTNKYVVEKTVLANTDYVINVKGAGYRTAIYNLNMGEEDRTLKFWNNYKDGAVVMEYNGNNELSNVKYNANFLAGDIVMDRIIDIYDLSAVVSYFGERGIIGVNDDYVKYDLNRDGNIDSIDVSILLTSWGK
ncbi:MAG: hypothetical protein E7415_01625 [Ruminococcaceae bacterium]|nr:hypothetical protein [Oscillospiraceae bacterium]